MSHCTERLGERANCVSAKNHVTPGHGALSNRVLSVRRALISENAKSIPVLAAKARCPLARRRDCMLWNQSAPRPGLQICLVSRKTRRRKRGWDTARSFRRYIVVGYSFNAAPNGLHTSYGRSVKWQTFYTALARTHSFFWLHFVQWVPEEPCEPYRGRKKRNESKGEICRKGE